MPDWTTHLGGAYLAARPWGKRDLRFFLLGALLPDFFARLESLALDLLQVNFFADYAIGAFHTPLLIFLLSALLALFSSQPKRCCRLIFSGGLFHLFLDMLESKVAHFGEYLLFPFSYRLFQFNLLPPTGTWLYVIWGFSLLILLYAAWEKKENILCLRPKASWPKVLGLLTLILLIPWLTSPIFEAHNAGYGQFLEDPAAFEGQQVSLYVSQVVSEDPLTVAELSRRFPLVTSRRFKKGEWISLEGIYRQGKIYPRRIQRELGVAAKSLLSLPALLLFPLLWWDWRSWGKKS